MTIWESWVTPRRVPNVVSLLGAIFALSFVGQWIELLAHIFPGDRFPDLMSVFVLVPLWNTVFLGMGAVLVSRLVMRPIEQALSIAWKALPILLLPPLFNLLAAWIGISATDLPVTSLGHLPFEIMTLGTYPQPLASWGVLLTLALCGVGVFFFIDGVTQRRARAMKGTVLFFIAYLLLLSLPSMLAWFGLEAGLTSLSASPYGVQRGLIFLSNEGYWWKNLYDRFLGTGIGEAQAAVRLLLGALTYLLLAGIAILYEVKRRGEGIRQEFLQVKPWGLLFYSSILVFGGILGLTQGATFSFRFTNVMACLILALTWIMTWFFLVYRNDLADLPKDELTHPTYPLVSGAVNPRVWQERIPLLVIGAAAGALLLGWPVFVCLGSFVLFQEFRVHPWLRLKESFWSSILALGMSAVTLLLAGWFFILQDVSLTRLSPRFFIAFFVFFLLLLTQKAFRDESGYEIKAFIEQKIVKGRVRWETIEAFLVICAYLLLPLILHWWNWWMISLPIGLISGFTALSSPSRPSRTILWMALFFLISGFFLSLQGYSP